MPWRGSHPGGQGQLADAAMGAPSAQLGAEQAGPSSRFMIDSLAVGTAPIPFPGIDREAPMTSGHRWDQTIVNAAARRPGPQGDLIVDPKTIADRYYDAWINHAGDMTDVPLADD